MDNYQDKRWDWFRWTVVTILILTGFYVGLLTIVVANMESMIHEHLHELNDVLIPQLINNG